MLCPPASAWSISVPRGGDSRCPCAWPSFSRKGLGAFASSPVARPAAPLLLGVGTSPSVSPVLTPGQPTSMSSSRAAVRGQPLGPVCMHPWPWVPVAAQGAPRASGGEPGDALSARQCCGQRWFRAVDCAVVLIHIPLPSEVPPRMSVRRCVRPCVVGRHRLLRAETRPAAVRRSRPHPAGLGDRSSRWSRCALVGGR